MALQHFTRCIEPERFRRRSIPGMVAMAGVFAAPFIAFAIVSGHPFCLAFALLMGHWMYWILYAENWLFERLICLGGDREAIGLAIYVSEPRGISLSTDTFDFDNDYSINVLLQCTELGVKEADQALRDSPYGGLIRNQTLITDLGSEVPGYEKNGYDLGDHDPTGSATLHCEFEGSGNHDQYLLAQAMLGIATAAFAVCIFVPWWVSLIILILLFLAGLIGMLINKVGHPGSPSDVNPGLPTIHKDQDVLYIQGTWVYDPLHEGYNEIHPIKVCCKIGCWKGDWINTNCEPNGGPTGYDDACLSSTEPPIILRLRNGFKEAQAEETLANQKRPEHQWHFHPDLDGCAPQVIL
ncbi:hypothetical protein BH20ACI3_BH20ACI3_32360 [soil metagenome]